MCIRDSAHWDHIGGHKYFDDIAVHEAEKDWLFVKFPIPRQTVIEALTKVPCPFPSGFNIEKYRIFQGFPKKLLHDKERIDIGGRVIEAIHTPGHSPGHCCFYEPKRKYLYSGDLIYSGCLDIFYPTTNPQQFRDSVKRIRALAVSYTHLDVYKRQGGKLFLTLLFDSRYKLPTFFARKKAV